MSIITGNKQVDANISPLEKDNISLSFILIELLEGKQK